VTATELALPQGSPLDQADVDAIAQMATAKGWTTAQAQSALNDMTASVTAQRQAFRAELDAHPEIGGAHTAQAQEHALRAMDRFLPPTTPEGQQLRTAITKSGYSDYAPLVLLLSRIGKAMSEDPGLRNPRTATTPTVKPLADRLFGDTPSS
jgi:hypothetical protein